MKKRLLAYAESVGVRISREYISNHGYFPKEPWGCEGQIYPSLTGIALLRLFEVTKKEIFISGVKAVIESNIKKQMPSGGWPLYLGVNANGAKFSISEDLIKITSEVEDLPPTVAALRLISEYQQVTCDTSYSASLDSGYYFLKGFWNEELGAFNEMLVDDALRLRANPKDYHIYSFQCIKSLSKVYAEASKYIMPLYGAVKNNFEAMTADTYPLLHGMHAALIANTERGSKYVSTVVKDRIMNEIVVKSRFLISQMPGAMGHRDGLRGICLDEGHLRNSIGAALAIDSYESATGTDYFSSMTLYADIENWIQSMYDDGKYFEYLDINSGLKLGDGSAGYFLPIFWILGQI